MTRKFLLMAALLLGAIAGAAATSPTGDKDIVAALPREAISSPAASNHGPEAVPGSKRSAPRLALVIGNARYPDAETPLPGVTEDARALADGLKRSGFQVEIEENLTRDGLRDALDHFEAKITPGAAALLFFDGFGIQAGRQSYLIPVDAQIWVEADVRRSGISVESVLSEMSEKGAGAKIAIIDASRRNPFERRFRSFSSGLASADAPNGALVFYANSPGKVAIEGDRDPFVLELLAAIRTPGLSADEVFTRTRNAVSRASNGEQVPFVSSSLAEDFYFGPLPAAPKQTVDPAPVRVEAAPTSLVTTQDASRPTPPKEPDAAREARQDYELAERVATRAGWTAFISRHPAGFMSDLAREQLAKLDREIAKTEPASPPAAQSALLPADTAAADRSRYDGWWEITSNVVEAGICRPTKAFSFRILDGRIDGPRFAGSVDPQGNLTGVFGEGSALSDVAGRLSPGEGSGTWRMKIGCSGHWSVARM
jgi:uncharacterized caspase-like protein